MPSIGFRIKTLRKELKMNQKDFSSAIGISQGTLSDIENEKSYPAIETILSLFGYIEISADWLLKGIGGCSPNTKRSETTSNSIPNLKEWDNLYIAAPEEVRPYLLSMVQAFLQTLPKQNKASLKNQLISSNTDEDAATIRNETSNIA